MSNDRDNLLSVPITTGLGGGGTTAFCDEAKSVEKAADPDLHRAVIGHERRDNAKSLRPCPHLKFIHYYSNIKTAATRHS